jgi:hypothetical protein
MTTIYERLNINFTNFGEASNLSPGAANSLSFIAENTPPMPDWQKADLANGNIQKTDYFQNPMANNVATITANTTIIINSGNLVGDSEMVSIGQALNDELQLYKKHTDNISGVTIVNSSNVPAYDTASSVGQQIMMILAKTDGMVSVKNTAPILGAFTSLFIRDEMKANNDKIAYYANIYFSNTQSYGEGYINLLPPEEIANIKNYLTNTRIQIYTRRTEDVTFYLNAVQIMQDYGYMQQFSNAGGTNTYLMKNVVGTKRLANNLSSNT